ncbi:MAG: hypothetical protein J6B10_02970 [Lachnospiraceae bacterium]|nr:hypothetical protein [Lachnospiraceae bacterium]
MGKASKQEQTTDQRASRKQVDPWEILKLNRVEAGQILEMPEVRQTLEEEAAEEQKLGWLERRRRDKSEDFRMEFEGTQILGKDGYQVRGGMINVFEGGALNLAPAFLTGSLQKKGAGIFQRVTGANAVFLTIPKNAQSASNIRMNEVFLSKDENGNTFLDAHSTTAFQIGGADGAIYRGQDLHVMKGRAILAGNVTKQYQDGTEKHFDVVQIDNSGIYAPQEEAARRAEQRAREAEELQNQVNEAGNGQSQTGGNEVTGAETGGTEASAQAVLSEEASGGTAVEEAAPLALQLFGRQGSSEDEEEQEDDEEEDSGTLEGAIEDAKEFWEKLGLAWDDFVKFCKTGELPPEEVPGTEKQDEDSEDISLEIPLFPGINFVLELEPSYEYQFALNLVKGQSEEGLELSLQAALFGKIALRVTAAIEAGLGYLFSIKGGLFAEGALEGNVETGQTFQAAPTEAEGSPVAYGDIGIKMGKKEGEQGGKQKIMLEAPDRILMDAMAGVDLKMALGGSITAGSKLFDWEKDWEYNFEEWTLASLGAGIHASTSFREPLKGWKIDSTTETMKGIAACIKERKDENFGFRMKQHQTFAAYLNNSTDRQTEEIDSLIQQYEDCKAVLAAEQSGNMAAKPEEAQGLKDLWGKLEQIDMLITRRISSSASILKLIEDEKSVFLGDKKIQKVRDKLTESVKKHTERLNKLEQWSAGFEMDEEGQKQRDEEAMSFYQKEMSAKGIENEQKAAAELSAKKQVAGKDALIAYETQRRNESARMHTKRLNSLKQKAAEMGMLNEQGDFDETKMQVKNPDFCMYYIDKLGGSNMKKQLSLYSTDKKKFIEYEQSRLADVTQKHRTRLEQLKKKAAEGVTGAEFVNYYHKEMHGKQFFKPETLLRYHNSAEEILDYEREKTGEEAVEETMQPENTAAKEKTGTTGRHIRRLDKLLGYQKRYQEAAEGEREKIVQEAKNWYFNEEGASKIMKDGDAWHYASKEDILEYENTRSQIKQQEGAGAMDRIKKKLELGDSSENAWKEELAKEKEYIQKAKEEVGHGIAAEIRIRGRKMTAVEADELKQRNVAAAAKEDMNLSNYKNFLQMWIQREDVDDHIVETLSLEEIRLYELKRKKELSEKLFSSASEVQKHENRIKALEEAIQEKNEITGNDEVSEAKRQQIILDAKNSYFGVKDAKGKRQHDRLIEEIKSGDFISTGIAESVLDEPEAVMTKHQERLEKLNAHKDQYTDAQFYSYYMALVEQDKKLGGLLKSGFESYWKDKNSDRTKDSFSLDEMIRYEQSRARELSKQGWLVRTKKKLQGKLTSPDEDELETIVKLEGGHYDRYMALKQLRLDGASDAEIVSQYQQMGGGKGFVKSLEDGGFQTVTAQEILTYEESRKEELGKKHNNRLAFLESIEGDTMPPEKAREYREMAQKDGDSGWERVKAFMSSFRNVGIGFDKTLDPVEVLTPMVIIRYEQEREKETGKKHQERLDQLMGAADDEAAWKLYMEDNGPKKRFLRQNRSLVKQKAKENAEQQNWGYEEIVDYETKRQNYYQEMLDEVNQPLKTLEASQTRLQNSIDGAKEMQEELADLLKDQKEGNPLKSRSVFQEKLNGPVAKLKDTSKEAQQSEENAEQSTQDMENLQKTTEELDKLADEAEAVEEMERLLMQEA